MDAAAETAANHQAGRKTAGLVAAWAALGATALTLVVAAGYLDRLDDSVRSLVAAARSPAGIRFMTAVSHLGSEYATLPVVLGLAYWMGRRHRLFARHFIVVALTSPVWQIVLKRVVGRPRPWPPLLSYWHGLGYPSGHVLNAASIALFLVLYLAHVAHHEEHRTPHRVGRGLRGAYAALFTWPILMAVSRVYVDAHWAMDVVGGLALGLLHVASWYYLLGWRLPVRVSGDISS